MKKLLIADTSQQFAQALKDFLTATYQVTLCHDGKDTWNLLQTLRPDILVINLALPYLDGLHILENAQHKPAIILALADSPSSFTLQRLKDAGVSYVVRPPCTARCVANHIRELIYLANQPPAKIDPQVIIEEQLIKMGFPSHRAGFKQLIVGIPIFSQDEDILMKEELYPAIASLCGKDDPRLVERTMRDLIKDVWEDRDQELWAPFFPNRKKYPPNKVFIKAMALWLNKQLKEKTRSE